jgi:hypothetical protein
VAILQKEQENLQLHEQHHPDPALQADLAAKTQQLQLLQTQIDAAARDKAAKEQQISAMTEQSAFWKQQVQDLEARLAAQHTQQQPAAKSEDQDDFVECVCCKGKHTLKVGVLGACSGAVSLVCRRCVKSQQQQQQQQQQPEGVIASVRCTCCSDVHTLKPSVQHTCSGQASTSCTPCMQSQQQQQQLAASGQQDAAGPSSTPMSALTCSILRTSSDLSMEATPLPQQQKQQQQEARLSPATPLKTADPAIPLAAELNRQQAATPTPTAPPTASPTASQQQQQDDVAAVSARNVALSSQVQTLLAVLPTLQLQAQQLPQAARVIEVLGVLLQHRDDEAEQTIAAGNSFVDFHERQQAEMQGQLSAAAAVQQQQQAAQLVELQEQLQQQQQAGGSEAMSPPQFGVLGLVLSQLQGQLSAALQGVGAMAAFVQQQQQQQEQAVPAPTEARGFLQEQMSAVRELL